MNAATVIGILSIVGTIGAVVLLIFELAGRRVVDRPLHERLLLIVLLAVSAFVLAVLSSPGSRSPAKRLPDSQKASSEITIAEPSLRADVVPKGENRYRRSARDTIVDAAALQFGSSDALAILIVDTNNEPVGELVVATRQTIEPSRKVISPFTGRVFESGIFEALYGGRGSRYLRGANATRWAREVLIGRLHDTVSRNDDYDGVVSSRLQLDVRVITTASGEITTQFDLNAIGVGFSERDARIQALRRLTNDFSERVVDLR